MEAKRCIISGEMEASAPILEKVSPRAAKAMLNPPAAEPVIPASTLIEATSVMSGFGEMLVIQVFMIAKAARDLIVAP